MENIKRIHENETHEFLMSLVYGKTIVGFSSFNSWTRFNRCITVINELMGKGTIRIDQEDEIGENDNYLDSWDKTHAVVWADKDNAPPRITEDEIDLPERILQAKLQKTVLVLDINPKLKRLAKKLAEFQGIRITVNTKGICATGKDNSEPVRDRMKKAYEGGAQYINFPKNEVDPQTLRVYASQFNSVSGTKFSVNIIGDIVRVQFVQPTIQEAAISGFKQSVLAMIAAEVITDEQAIKIIDYAFWNPANPQAPQNLEATQTTTGNNAAESGSDTDDVQDIAPNGQIFIKDPNETPKDQFSDDDDF